MVRSVIQTSFSSPALLQSDDYSGWSLENFPYILVSNFCFWNLSTF